MVRVRIAPSPTGFAHVGTAYTALFNYAFAKKNSGKFIVRIEDTDVKRRVEGAEEAIFKGLNWLGISWDESIDKGKHGPYRQSERLELYREKVKELEKNGFAYKDDGAVRFKNPGEDVSWSDLIKGEITFPGGEITDFVILKSDGYPTYNFAVVVDDLEMKITHVIRGEDHVSNTPRQIALYKAFGEKLPKFAHHPTLRNKEHKKLSKRRDPVDIEKYKKEGYLPPALVNFLCLLGWSHPREKEIFDLSEFVELFTLERVRKAGPIFNVEKLDWMNGEYIRKAGDAKLADIFYEFSGKKYSQEEIKKVTPLVKDRIKRLTEFEGMAGFFFRKPKVDKKLFGKDYKEHINSALAVLTDVGEWKKERIDSALVGMIKGKGYHTGKFFMNFRIAIAGGKVTPPINESIVILGKEETLERLKNI